jgi:UDP-glucose:(glucosyl)LPS alpha-1,2-glucosyltransferase
MTPIAVLLPTREKFSPQGAGALAINARDFATGSRFHWQTTVYGAPVDQPFPDVQFVPLHNKAMLFKSAGHLRAFRRALDGESPTIIEVWNRPIFVASLRRWFPRAHIALQLGNDAQDMRGARTPQERRNLLRVVSRVYTCTNWLRERFLEGLGPGSENARVVTIYRAIDIPERPATKENLVLFVGRIVSEKGALLFAQTMRALLPAFPDWRAQIVGGVKHGHLGDTPYSLQVARELAQLGAQATVTGYLPLPEVRALMGRASILCVPALWNEPIGRVSLEGMAEGALVATTGRGGLSEVVGDAGLIINSEDPHVWAESLRPWLAAPERLVSAAEKGRRQSIQFAPERVIAKLDAERTALLGSSARLS